MKAVIAIITERIVVPDLQEYYEQMNSNPGQRSRSGFIVKR